MNFIQFKVAVQERMDYLIKNSVTLFTVDVSKDTLWSTYINSFPQGTNPIFLVNRKYECNCCRSFVNHYGNIVGIVDGEIMSIWDIQVDDKFQVVADALKALITTKNINGIFLIDEIYGIDQNTGTNNDAKFGVTFDHLYPCKAVKDFKVTNVATKISDMNSTFAVVKRSFEEITPSAVTDIIELIQDGSLYRGEEMLAQVKNFKDLQQEWLKSKRSILKTWEIAIKNGRFAAIRNTAIGTLLTDISDGMEIDAAVHSYGSKMVGYKRPTEGIITKAQKDAAEKFAIEHDIINSLETRHAKLSDLKVTDVLWASNKSGKLMQSVFDIIPTKAIVKKETFENVEEVGISYFIDNLLPQCKTLEVLVENTHKANFMNLLIQADQTSKSLMSWGNPFRWNYNGGNADSVIKMEVERLGGKIDGVFNARLAWNIDGKGDVSDYDLWATEPSGTKIGFSSNYRKDRGNNRSPDTGQLDLDNTGPTTTKMAVENITWIKEVEGTYKIWVNQYSARQSKGFTVELEMGGEVYICSYNKPTHTGSTIQVATVTLKNGKWSVDINKDLSTQSNTKTQEIWGVNTQEFIPVSSVMLSPNYWGHDKGNKHFFFILEGCKNPESSRGFFNEFLSSEFSEHRKVFNVLGSKMSVAPDGDQMAGLGFSSTMKNYVVIKFNNKPVKINFNNESIKLSETSKVKSKV